MLEEAFDLLASKFANPGVVKKNKGWVSVKRANDKVQRQSEVNAKWLGMSRLHFVLLQHKENKCQ